MTLEPCPNCKRNISAAAVTCPKCGQPMTPELWQKARQRRNWWAVPQAIIFLAVIGFVIVAVLQGDDEPRSSYSRAERTQLPVSEQMALVFVGDHSAREIELLLDETMPSFGSPSTEDQRQRWGDVLVSMRKHSGVPEMEILRCVRAMGPTGGKFADAAAICGTLLEAK